MQPRTQCSWSFENKGCLQPSSQLCMLGRSFVSGSLQPLWAIVHRLFCPWLSRQEHWNRLPFPTPGSLLNPGIKPVSLASPALAGGFFTTGATWEAHSSWMKHLIVTNLPRFTQPVRGQRTDPETHHGALSPTPTRQPEWVVPISPHSAFCEVSLASWDLPL